MARRRADRYIRYYTDGSAARQLEIEVPRRERKPLPKVKKQPKRVIYIQPLPVVGVAISLVMLCMMISGAVQLAQAQQQVTLMSGHIEKLAQENEDLQTRFDEKCDLEKIEQSALALGMIPESEAPQMRISVEMPEDQIQEPTLWERIGDFFAGLFA